MSRLQRVLGLRDLVLFNIVAIVGLRWVALAAAGGPSSITLWVLALAAFFIPQGLAVARLGSLYPAEGGVYAWAREAFGPRHGFIAGWCYWANNVIYYPTLLVALAGFATFIGGSAARHLEASTTYIVSFSMIVLWIGLGLNILGMRTGRWVQNAGGLATWIPALLLVAFGVVAWTRFGSATPITSGNIWPDIGRYDTVSFFSEICFAFAGLELAAVLAEEIRDPRRDLHRAMLLSGVAITLIYVLGTLAILVAVPAGQVSVITGVLQAIDEVAERIGVRGASGLVGALMTIGGLGGVGAWLGGSARILFVAGLDRYLPPALARIHPRWGSPYVALLVQGVLATLFILAGSAGAGPRAAYLVLVDTTLVVYFIPYLYMFLALIKLDRPVRGADAGAGRSMDIPGGRIGIWIAGLLGFAAVALAIGMAVIPGGAVERPGLHMAKVLGGTAFFVASALFFYERGRVRIPRDPGWMRR